jgi:hypothetical protein
MFERVGGEDAHAARVAGNNLNEIVGNSISYMLGFGLHQEDSFAKQWAGQFLGGLEVSLEKHHKKLSKTNAAYRKERKKIGKLRSDVLFPRLKGAIVQRELKKAERHRRSLLLLREVLKPRDLRLVIGDETRPFGTQYWKKVAQRSGIPQEYFVTVKLPQFSMKSEPQWWKFLWPQIKRNNPNLLAQLRSRYPRAERVDPRDKKSVPRASTTRWTNYRTEFRNHLQTLARHRDCGVL